jgi:hypothetical protein
VWITVIATRFDEGAKRVASERRALESGPEERRPSERRPAAREPRARDFDLDVPEYVPGR